MKRNTILLAVLCFFAVTFTLAAGAQTADKEFDITGKWNAMIHTPDKTITEVWDITHEGAELHGMAKTADGDATLSGRLDGKIVRGLLKRGDQNTQVHLTVDGDDMDGTIRMGKNEYLLMLRRAK